MLFIFPYSLYALPVYRVYETKAIIISSRDKGETSRDFKILTREFGVIHASAQGVRRPQSKLKSFLVPFRPINLFIVRGREVWRIVNVTECEYKTLSVIETKHIARPLSLVVKLVHGEEYDVRLYSLIENLYVSILNTQDSSLRICAEELTSLRIMFILGYVRIPPIFTDLIDSDLLSPETLERFKPLRKEAVSLVNEALRMSHLS